LISLFRLNPKTERCPHTLIPAADFAAGLLNPYFRELAQADRLDQLLELGPVDLLRDLHEPVVRCDLDRGPRRPWK
jgi:hypothetical protein